MSSFLQCAQQSAPPMVKPGDIITFQIIDTDSEGLLPRTPSTYGYHVTLHLTPSYGSPYIVCNGSIQNGFCLILQDKPSTPVGFGLFFDPALNGYFLRVTQVGFDPLPITLEVIGKTKEYPIDKYFIGSRVLVANVFDAAP